jgi:HEPN domain-containing protein
MRLLALNRKCDILLLSRNHENYHPKKEAKMPERWKDWLTQAKRDLNHAENACRDGDFEWSCFSAQQSAEKAVKSVFLYLHGEGWGHSVFGLLRNLSPKTNVPEPVLEAAKILDKHYIPARYPNGFDIGFPGDYYTQKEAKEAIGHAGKIIQFCESILCR